MVRKLCDNYEIDENMSQKILDMIGWDFVFIVDDSGSMDRSVKEGEEAGKRVKVVIEFGCALDPDEVCFLFLNMNRGRYRVNLDHVTSYEQVKGFFRADH